MLLFQETQRQRRRCCPTSVAGAARMASLIALSASPTSVSSSRLGSPMDRACCKTRSVCACLKATNNTMEAIPVAKVL